MALLAQRIKLALRIAIEKGYRIIDVSNIQIKKEDSKTIGKKIKIKALLHMLIFEKEDIKKSLILNVFSILK